MGERVLARGTVVRLRAQGQVGDDVVFSSGHAPGDVGVISGKREATLELFDSYYVLVPYRSCETYVYYTDEFDVLQEPFTEGKEP